jgi:hypothetical protein
MRPLPSDSASSGRPIFFESGFDFDDGNGSEPQIDKCFYGAIGDKTWWMCRKVTLEKSAKAEFSSVFMLGLFKYQ